MVKRKRLSLCTIKNKKKNFLICEAINPGTIFLHKKLFLLGKEFKQDNYSSKLDVKDITDLEKINELGVNIITTQINDESSFDEIYELLGDKQMKIFARIETSEAIFNIDSIIEKCDGIIFDHGFISTKIPYEDVI